MPGRFFVKSSEIIFRDVLWEDWSGVWFTRPDALPVRTRSNKTIVEEIYLEITWSLLFDQVRISAMFEFEELDQNIALRGYGCLTSSRIFENLRL